MPPNQVTLARKKLGLPMATAAKRAGISRQVLGNLEQIPGATRDTDPLDCKLRTILALCELCWPHLNIENFDPESPFRLVPRSKAIGQRLRRNVGKPLS